MCIIVYANVYNEIGEERYNVVHVVNIFFLNLLKEGNCYNFCIEQPKIIKNKYLNMKKGCHPVQHLSELL